MFLVPSGELDPWCKEVEVQDYVLAWANGSDFDRPFLPVTEERNKKQLQNNLNRLNLLLCTWGMTTNKKICQLTTKIFCFEDLLI